MYNNKIKDKNCCYRKLSEIAQEKLIDGDSRSFQRAECLFLGLSAILKT